MRGELGLFDHGVDLNAERVEGALEWSGGGAQCRERGCEAGAQEPIVGAGEEQGDAQGEVGDLVAEAFRHTLDQAMQVKPAQLVGDGALGDRCLIDP